MPTSPSRRRLYSPSSRYCESCNFRIDRGDPVTAVYRTTTDIKSTHFTFTLPKLYRGHDFVLEDGEELHFCDDVPCRHLIMKYGSYDNVVCHHTPCYKLRASTDRVDELLEKSSWGNFPPPDSDTMRVGFLRDTICGILGESIKPWLPPEILLQIILLLPISTLRLAATAAWCQCWSSGDIGTKCLDISQKVYQQTFMLEGRTYIRQLSNSPSPQSTLLSIPQPSTAISRIDIAEDRLGITEVVFAADRDRCEIEGPIKNRIWWRSLKPRGNIVHTVTNVSRKLCDIQDCSSPPLNPYISWNRRGASKPLLDLKTLQPYVNKHRLRMRSLELGACVTGFSAACSTGRMVILHAHTPKESVAFYRAIGASYHKAIRLDWVFFPMQRGEFLVQIRRRKGPCEDNCLIFTTNQGRSCLFGQYIQRHIETDIVTYSRDGISSPIYFNEWDSSVDKRIEFIACDPPEGIIPDASSEPEVLSIGPSHGSLSWDWFRTCAPLVDVVGIVTCRNTDLPHRPFIGMLLLYSNGRRECLGSFRMDFQCERIVPQKRPHAIFLYVGGEKRANFVKHIQFDKPLPRNDNEDWKDPCLQVLLGHGMFEWYFGHLGVEIMYRP